MLSHWWGHTGGGIPIYPGMAWGFTGDLYDGVAEYSSFSGRALRGCSYDSSVETGVSTSTPLKITTTTDGAHSGPADIGVSLGREYSLNTNTGPGYDETSKGAHSHVLSINHTPYMNKVRLVVATKRLNHFPLGSILFSASGSLDSCFDYSLFNDYKGILTIGSSNIRQAATTDVFCSTVSVPHTHVLDDVFGSRVDTAIATNVSSDSMTHLHSVWTTIRPNLKRVVLSAWEAMETIRNVSGAPPIVIYFGEGVPEGWLLCDGTNGTPNTVSRFIQNLAESDVDGDNTVAISAATNTAYHNHDYGGVPTWTGIKIPHKSNVGHSHSAYGTRSWVPAYLYVKFLQYGG